MSDKYCPWCSTPLEERVVDGSPHMACPNCSYVDWRNPAPNAGCLIERDGKILLVYQQTRVGDFWALPGGFVDSGERAEETAVREVREETGFNVRLTGCLGTYTHPLPREPDRHYLRIVFTAEIIGGELHAADDAVEGRFFGIDELPWDELRPVDTQALQEWLRRRKGARP